MKASLTGLGAAALALALAACAPQSSPLKLGPLQTAASAPPQAAAAGGGNAASQTQAPAPAPPEGPRSFTSPGTGVFVNPASAGAARPALVRTGANGQTSLNLVDASIPEAANAVLGDALGLNYVVKPTVSGSVTLQTSTPLGPDALLEAFQTALEYNGATLIDGGGLVSIVPVTDAPPRFVEIGDQRGAGRRIVVVPLEYVSAADMVRLLEPVATGSTVLDVNQERNILMVTGGAAEIDAVLDGAFRDAAAS